VCARVVGQVDGGSSADEATARGADLIGPVKSSGTNSTISATRMIAPVNRSFTRSTYDWGYSG
jgi:hypothetical protein